MKSALLSIALLAAPLTVVHANGDGMPMLVAETHTMNMPAAGGDHDMTVPAAEGVVRKIDRDAGKITLRHGVIKSINMPSMTMVYKAANASLLEGLKAGDRVRFDVEKRDGVDTITRIERQH